MAGKFDELWDVEWLLIPGQKYMMKYKFENYGYSLLVTNFSELYGEKLTHLEAYGRFFETNPFVCMKNVVIMRKVQQSLESSLSSSNDMRMLCFDKHLLFELEFSVDEASFFYDLKPQLLSAENLRKLVIAPTVLSTFLCFQENKNLTKKLEDSERKISSPQESEIDKKSNDVLCAMKRKSKIDVQDVLETFVKSQKSMLKYINDSKNCKDQPTTTKPSEARKTEELLPSKRESVSEAGNSSNIKYEDKANISIKYEDSSDSSDSLCLAPKLKKKKTFKI